MVNSKKLRKFFKAFSKSRGRMPSWQELRDFLLGRAKCRS